MEEDMNHSGFIHLLKPKYGPVVDIFEFSIVLRAWSKKQFFKETLTNEAPLPVQLHGAETWV